MNELYPSVSTYINTKTMKNEKRQSENYIYYMILFIQSLKAHKMNFLKMFNTVKLYSHACEWYTETF